MYTPTGGDIVDFMPPYIGSRYSGRFLNLNRTEEVEGSNPSGSAYKSIKLGPFCISMLSSVQITLPLWTGLPLTFPCAVRVQFWYTPTQTVDSVDNKP
jgi:hypothetical protein